MMTLDTFRLPDNPMDESTGLQLPSLFGYEGALSVGIHPTPCGDLEVRIADEDGTYTESYPGQGVMDYAHTIRRVWLIASLYRAGQRPCGDGVAVA